LKTNKTMSDKNKISIQSLIVALLDESTVLSPQYLYRLSDLEGEELSAVQAAWPQIALRRRQALMEDIEALNEVDYLLSYEAISRLALRDPDPGVRLPALRVLWEYDPKDLIPDLLEMCLSNEVAEVRAGAASALGKFVYLGEIEELNPKTLTAVEDRLLELATGGGETLVRRRALEALGFSSRGEVTALIEDACEQKDDEWLATALFAMGRSADQQWIQFVLDHLTHQSPSVRMEAARAAGELEAKKATPQLLGLLDDIEDPVRETAIWALSQVGGPGVKEALQDLLDDADDINDVDLLESALDNLAFTEDLDSFSLLEFDEDSLKDSLSQAANGDNHD
jgi:HEAT repeat protein